MKNYFTMLSKKKALIIKINTAIYVAVNMHQWTLANNLSKRLQRVKGLSSKNKAHVKKT